MTEIVSKRVTYQELKDGTYRNAYIPQDNKFPVTSHLTTHLREALMACPGNDDDSKTFAYVFVDEEKKEIGREYLFGTHIKCGEKVYKAQTGCGLEVIEEYRGESVGAELMLFLSTNNEYDFVIGAGISQMILPMYRKLKYLLFEVPQYYKVRHARYVFRSLGLKSWLLLGSFIVQKVKDILKHVKWNRLKEKFVIKKETVVPEWAGEMATNDGHKYMELHDREWLQWNLDYNTYGYDEDIQSFYSIFDGNNKPMGFFMTKERIIKKPGNPNNGFVIGTVVEWESCDRNKLSEADINLLANQTFSKRVDAIYTLACESETERQLKGMGYIKRASFKVGIKDKKKQLKDVGDQSLWRLRYGYTNMFIL